MIKAMLSIKVLPAFLLCLALMAGCGGSDNDSQTNTAEANGNEVTAHAAPVTKAEFVKQASAICLAAKERASEEFSIYLEKNNVPSSGPGMAAKAQDVVNTVFGPVFELQVKKIRGLGAPREDVVEVSEILTAMQQGVERAKEEPLEFMQKETAMNQASKLVEAYGLPDCSNGKV